MIRNKQPQATRVALRLLYRRILPHLSDAALHESPGKIFATVDSTFYFESNELTPVNPEINGEA